MESIKKCSLYELVRRLIVCPQAIHVWMHTFIVVCLALEKK